MKATNDVSIVLPVYNEEETIQEAIYKLMAFIETQTESIELIFVDDGSRDRSVEIIKQAMQQNQAIKLVQFSRNFGHQLAISCGIRYATGEAVVVMDADLQDPPEVVGKMIMKWRAGYDVVYGKRSSRKGETIFKKQTASLFYRVLRKITNIDIPIDTGDFRLMDRKVVEVLKEMNETHPYVRGMVSWSGFKQTFVEYERQERYAGNSKYSLSKMIGLAMDGVTSFSIFPLKIANYAGSLLLIISFLYLISFGIATKFTLAHFILFSILFVGSLIMLMLGMIGMYVGRIFEQSRGRPLFVVSDVRGFEERKSEKNGVI